MQIIVRAIPRAGTRCSHFRLRSWFSNVYFRPSNRLSEPTGSISIALKGREQGTYMSALCQVSWIFPAPCYCTFYSTLPSQNSEHTRDTFRGKCPMIVPSFFTAIPYQLEAFSGSLSHTNDSSTTASIHKYMVALNTLQKSFPQQLLSLYVSSLRSSLPLLMCTCCAKANYAITNAML